MKHLLLSLLLAFSVVTFCAEATYAQHNGKVKTAANKKSTINYETILNTLLTEDDLENESMSHLKYLKNEVYARHGLIFKSSQWKNTFTNESWYTPVTEDTQEVYSKFSMIEKENVELIVKKIKGGN
ncbi:MAG: YARHG domain-containing protein [Bacteroidales bacterium]|jgi:hypothetical protein|nr:YARHG domain-containing protein [Bacteroidales bacterium]